MQYEQLINALEHGFHVLVKSKSSRGYQVISPIKDEDGDWRCSGWCDTPEEAKRYIGNDGGYTQEGLQEYCPNWELVEVFTLPFERWKVGDEVRIADNAKELCKKAGVGWDEEMQKMVGKKCEVKMLDDSIYHVWNEDKSFLWFFPHEALLPVFDEDEVEEMTVEQVCKELGREIKIVK